MTSEFSPEHESLLLQFESARKNNQPAEIGDFIDPETREAFPELLVELVLIDFELHYRNSADIAFDTYFEKFPQLSNPDLRKTLIREELALRAKWNDLPDQAEISRRFKDDQLAQQLLDQYATNQETPDNSIALFQSGSIIASYQIERCIGKGAFAIVYSATELTLKRRVAIKFLSKSDTNPDIHARMLREARAQASLQHQNIVAVYDVGEYKGFDYITSQLVEGSTLEKHFQSPDRNDTSSVQQRDFREAAEFAQQLASALHHAHSEGVIHRDVKPANIMIDAGVPMLLDFGLARMADSSLQLTHEGDVVGTPAFMPPEQADGHAYQADPRSDVYGLGAVLYWMVCRKFPFDGTAAQVVHQVLHSEPIVPRKINSRVSIDLQTIILKCLEKEPTRRYQSARLLQMDLDCFLQNKPIAAKPASLFSRGIKWAKRNPGITTAIACTLVLAAFLAGAASQINRIAAQRDRAQDAENETEKLLAQSAADAGQLAFQQGQLNRSISSFQNALQLGHPDPDALQLKLAKAWFILRDTDQARSAIEMIDPAANSRINSSKLLWEFDLADHQESSFDELEEKLDRLLQMDLAPADREYALALKASSTPLAIMHLERSLQIDSLHFRARQRLVFALLASARFDDAKSQLEVARQLYPESQDMLLFAACCNAGLSREDEFKALLKRAALNEKERQEWMELCEFIYVLRNHRDLNNFAGEPDMKIIGAIVRQFKSKFQPLISKRNWRLAIPVSRNLYQFASEFESVMTQTTQKRLDMVTKLAAGHPEGTLHVLLGNTYISLVQMDPDKRETEIDALEKARQEFEYALTAKGFTKNREPFAWKGIYTVSIALTHSLKHEPAKNTKAYVNAAKQLDTRLFENPFYVRTVVISLLNANQNELARKWVDRWKELTHGRRKSRIDALWHDAILLSRSKNWFLVKARCKEILALDENHQLSIDMLSKANNELRSIADDRP